MLKNKVVINSLNKNVMIENQNLKGYNGIYKLIKNRYGDRDNEN